MECSLRRGSDRVGPRGSLLLHRSVFASHRRTSPKDGLIPTRGWLLGHKNELESPAIGGRKHEASALHGEWHFRGDHHSGVRLSSAAATVALGHDARRELRPSVFCCSRHFDGCHRSFVVDRWVLPTHRRAAARLQLSAAVRGRRPTLQLLRANSCAAAAVGWNSVASDQIARSGFCHRGAHRPWRRPRARPRLGAILRRWALGQRQAHRGDAPDSCYVCARSQLRDARGSGRSPPHTCRFCSRPSRSSATAFRSSNFDSIRRCGNNLAPI